MNIYDLNKEDFKKIDKEFGKTVYGKYVYFAMTMPLALSLLSFVCSIVISVICMFDSEPDVSMLNASMFSLLGAFIMLILAFICLLMALKELRKYTEKRKKTK